MGNQNPNQKPQQKPNEKNQQDQGQQKNFGGEKQTGQGERRQDTNQNPGQNPRK